MQRQIRTAHAAVFASYRQRLMIAGTGAFIPHVPIVKRTAAYVPPALRGARGLPMRSAARSNPFTGKSLEQIAVMCHILNSKVLGQPPLLRILHQPSLCLGQCLS